MITGCNQWMTSKVSIEETITITAHKFAVRRQKKSCFLLLTYNRDCILENSTKSDWNPSKLPGNKPRHLHSYRVSKETGRIVLPLSEKSTKYIIRSKAYLNFRHGTPEGLSQHLYIDAGIRWTYRYRF